MMGRSYTAREIDKEEQTRQWVANFDHITEQDSLEPGKITVHGGVIGLPKSIFDLPNALERIREFSLGLDFAKSEEGGQKNTETPDAAAVSLANFTGLPWRLCWSGPAEFRQFRVETVKPVKDAQNMADALGGEMGCKVYVDKTSQKIFIPAALLPTPEKMQSLRKRTWEYDPEKNEPDSPAR